MKRLWLCLISVLLLVACSDDTPDMPIVKSEGRVILSYMVSNNAGGSLDDNLKNNLCDMYRGMVGLKEPATLLVYYRADESDKFLLHPSILKFVADGKGNVNGKPMLPKEELNAEGLFELAEKHPYKEADHVATDPKVMSRVLKDMIKLAPAASYGLTMGSHGTGWLKGKETADGRSFGDDDGVSINIPELGATLESAFEGQKLDFVLFDACMMANAEVAYELQNVAHYCIASVMETPAYGYPYAKLMNILFSKNVNYQQVCDEFVELSRVNDWWATCAAIDCSKIQLLSDWVKANLAESASQIDSDFCDNVQQYGVRRTYSSYENFSFDVVDIFRQLYGQVPSDLLSIMNQVVVAKNCLEGEEYSFGNVIVDKERFCGIGMYIPYYQGNTSWDEYYENSLGWAKAVEWTKYKPAE